MEWPSLLYALRKIFPAILHCQQNVTLDIAIRHAPETKHNSLWPVPVRILECP